MIPTHVIPHRNGELRIGWASWDDGRYEARSIKYAYPDSSGKISRGSPELPFDILVDMLLLALDQGELSNVLPQPAEIDDIRDVSEISLKELQREKKTLSVALTRLQMLIPDLRWANWQPIYDQLGERLESVRKEIGTR